MVLWEIESIFMAVYRFIVNDNPRRYLLAKIFALMRQLIYESSDPAESLASQQFAEVNGACDLNASYLIVFQCSLLIQICKAGKVFIAERNTI